MKLVSIPKEKYCDYRLDEMFDGYKRDPMFYDNNTIAKYALVITGKEAAELDALTKKLTAETIAAENFLNKNLPLTKPLSLPRQIRKLAKKMSGYDADKHVRLMRFDFHPVEGGGFAVSEVNSDVPGGFAEASVMPRIAAGYLGGNYKSVNFGEIMTAAIREKVPPKGRIAFVHCTSYSDDRQMVQFLGDLLEKAGYEVLYTAADHIKFENKKAVCVLDGNGGAVDFIFRFTPLEWLIGIKPKTWHGYFDTITPSCNHPAVIFTQTKRLPFLFDTLEKNGVDMSAWKSLLPETLETKRGKNKEGFILKPACGRVGEGISIPDSCPKDELNKIFKAAKRRPKAYIAQKMFVSKPLISDAGESFHVCFGAYSVQGKPAGYYARISKTRRIDSFASDIPVLIERGAE